jgi:hypothetical protein
MSGKCAMSLSGLSTNRLSLTIEPCEMHEAPAVAVDPWLPGSPLY